MPKATENLVRFEFTPLHRDRFRKLYKQAINAGKTTFIFEGHEMDTRYSAYLIEYWDMKGDKHHA